MRKAIGSAGLAAVISMGLLAAFPVMAWAAPVLPEGISAGSQSLAGMTAEEAKAAVEPVCGRIGGSEGDSERGRTGCGNHGKGTGLSLEQ